MKRRMALPGVRDERGQAMVFVLMTIIFLLVIGGLAVDLAWQYAVRSELQRSMDAASLAGAGKLGFNSDPFPTVRDFAVNFAQFNPFHVGTISLNRNDTNNTTTYNSTNPPYGDVLLGIWDSTKPPGIGNGLQFQPCPPLPAGVTDCGTVVNAVMTRYKTTLATSLLRMWGMTSLPMSAVSIAIANPPSAPPANGCTIPIGLSQCSFLSNQIFTTNGCGTVVKFITSNTQVDSTNTAGWVNLTPGQDANSGNIDTQVNNSLACNGGGPTVGNSLNTTNGMLSNAFGDLETIFRNKFNSDPTTHEIRGVKRADGTCSAGNPPDCVVYNGRGWEVFVPVMDTTCPAGAINGSLQVVGWSRMVLTQMWDPTGGNPAKNESWNSVNQSCLVNNIDDAQTWTYCTNPSPPSPLNNGNSRSVWGYYDCASWNAQPAPVPSPRSALATKLRLTY